MKLYHVSMGWTELSKDFIPRIPESRALHEDDTTKRICLSTSIEGCLSAMADKPYKSNTKITIYECDVDHFVDYNELYDSGKVLDAHITKECWYLEPITMNGKHLLLKYFECDCKFVPDEQLKAEFINHVLYYVQMNQLALPKDIFDNITSCSVKQLLYHILPPYFDNNNLDLDEVCEQVFMHIRTMYNLQLEEVE